MHFLSFISFATERKGVNRSSRNEKGLLLFSLFEWKKIYTIGQKYEGRNFVNQKTIIVWQRTLEMIKEGRMYIGLKKKDDFVTLDLTCNAWNENSSLLPYQCQVICNKIYFKKSFFLVSPSD